jgi:quercetin dioxygenase-like cupin family protein
MQVHKLSEMVKGWFVGDFSPTALATQAAEVALKTYRAGEHEARHHHKVATEITLIQSGRVTMNGTEYSAGDIVVIAPLESTDFTALEDTVTVVVKVPGAVNDKYLGDAP